MSAKGGHREGAFRWICEGHPQSPPAATCCGAPTHLKQPGTTKRGDKQIDRARVLEVRIHLPPAESLCLAGFRPPTPRSRAFSAGVQGGAGGAVGRDRRYSMTWRRLAGISLPGHIPVPQCRRCGSQQCRHWPASEVGLPRGVAISVSFYCAATQAKPSTVRCSCQPSGRRECASSLSAVRSRGWRPSRMAWVMSGER